MISNQWLALGITFALSLIWLRVNNYAAQRGWLSAALSRKIIHMGTGPLFVLCWLLFPGKPSDRYLAALVPLIITVQFFLVGTGIIKDPPAVQAMSRTGDRREILHGPLFYGLAFVALTIFYWMDNPIGIIALMLMCGGDGLADIVGRRYGKTRLPWNKDKSWVGSAGMFVGGVSFVIIVMAIYLAASVFPGDLVGYLPAFVIISMAGTLVETLPLKDIDNITVTLACLLVGGLLLGG
jgi:phytol kinase